MARDQHPPSTVDEYIDAFPSDVRLILQTIRANIKHAVPEGTERISYRMPTFFLNRVVVHYGAFKTHIGLFPPVRDPELISQTVDFRGEKGNLRFPLDQAIPYTLIDKIVRARVSEIRRQADAKRRASRAIDDPAST